MFIEHYNPLKYVSVPAEEKPNTYPVTGSLINMHSKTLKVMLSGAFILAFLVILIIFTTPGASAGIAGAFNGTPA
jgi:hypothetical protein